MRQNDCEPDRHVKHRRKKSARDHGLFVAVKARFGQALRNNQEDEKNQRGPGFGREIAQSRIERNPISRHGAPKDQAASCEKTGHSESNGGIAIDGDVVGDPGLTAELGAAGFQVNMVTQPLDSTPASRR